jgi:hypothetical protein
MVKDVLETSAVDETGFSLKQSKFNIYFEAIGEDGDFQVGDIMKITKFFIKIKKNLTRVF